MADMDFGMILDDAQAKGLLSDNGLDQLIADRENEGEGVGEKHEKESKEEDKVTEKEGEPSGNSESVGNEGTNNGLEDAAQGDGSSSPGFFSSIANALMEDGIFPDLETEAVKKVDSAQGLRDLITEQIKSELSGQQKRVADALDSGAKPDEVGRYEQTIAYLNGISNESVESEDGDGENLRKSLIYTDYINKGFSEERARKAVQRSVDAGTDVDDAKEALESVKAYWKQGYQDYLSNLKANAEKDKAKREKAIESLKKDMLDENKFFSDMSIDKGMRQKAFDAITKPVYKDKATGRYYTALQKAQIDGGTDFNAKLGLLFVATDGFKSLDKLVKGKVRKEVRKGIDGLERAINNTSRDSGGNIRFVGGGENSKDFLNGNFMLDL